MNFLSFEYLPGRHGIILVASREEKKGKRCSIERRQICHHDWNYLNWKAAKPEEGAPSSTSHLAKFQYLDDQEDIPVIILYCVSFIGHSGHHLICETEHIMKEISPKKSNLIARKINFCPLPKLISGHPGEHENSSQNHAESGLGC